MQDKVQELKGLLKELLEQNLDELQVAQEERIRALEAANSEQRKQIETLLSMPAQKVLSPVPGNPGATREIFLGKRLDVQGLDLARRARAGIRVGDQLLTVQDVPIIADEARRKEYAKFLLAVLEGSNPRSESFISAKQFLGERGVQKAPMAEGTGSTGGYLVPEEYADEVLAFARLQSLALQRCRIVPMSSDTRRVPAESTSVSVAWTGEGSAATEAEPTLAEVDLVAKRLDGYSIMSNELMQDSNVDVVSWLTELFAEAVGQELDNQVLNGTGTPCSGLLTAAAGFSVVMTAGKVSFSSVDATDLSNMISRLSVNRRLGAFYVMHRTVLHYIRTLKDNNNNYIWASAAQGQPGTIWGYPYYECEKAPTTSDASQSGKGFIVFGDWKYFLLGRRLGNMTLDVDPYGLFTTYQTRVRIVTRWGLKIGLNGAFVRLVTA